MTKNLTITVRGQKHIESTVDEKGLEIACISACHGCHTIKEACHANQIRTRLLNGEVVEIGSTKWSLA